MPIEIVEPALRYWSQNGDIVWFGQNDGILQDLVAKRQWLWSVFAIVFHLQPCHLNDHEQKLSPMQHGMLSHSDLGLVFPASAGFNGRLRNQILELIAWLTHHTT